MQILHASYLNSDIRLIASKNLRDDKPVFVDLESISKGIGLDWDEERSRLESTFKDKLTIYHGVFCFRLLELQTYLDSIPKQKGAVIEERRKAFVENAVLRIRSDFTGALIWLNHTEGAYNLLFKESDPWKKALHYRKLLNGLKQARAYPPEINWELVGNPYEEFCDYFWRSLSSLFITEEKDGFITLEISHERFPGFLLDKRVFYLDLIEFLEHSKSPKYRADKSTFEMDIAPTGREFARSAKMVFEKR